MVRCLSRLLVTACTLVALVATAVSPMAIQAMGDDDRADAHACCPETLGPAVPQGQPGGVPMPCCEIAGRSLPEPVRGQAARTGVAASTPAPETPWQQAVRLTSGPRRAPSVPPVQIPPLLRSTVLLI